MEKRVVSSWDLKAEEEKLQRKKEQLISELVKLAAEIGNLERTLVWETEGPDYEGWAYVEVNGGKPVIIKGTVSDYGTFESEFSGEELQKLSMDILERAVWALQRKIGKGSP